MNILQTRKSFGFIGLGLIGGSVARCIRAAMPEAQITAYNYRYPESHPKLALALSDGVLSSITPNLEEFAGCDVIFLCAPVLTNIAYLKKLAPYLGEGCILTDVGSVKGQIYRAVQDAGLEHCFIGGHPMAGTEKIGYEHSFAGLLRDCYYILTPTPQAAAEDVEWMQAFIAEVVHAECVTIDVDEHDRATAGISHAPHIISAALVNAVHARDDKGIYQLLAAGGFKDITRISSSSPEMWQNICQSNKNAILGFLEEYAQILARAKTLVEQEDTDGLLAFFANAKAYRDRLLNPSDRPDNKK